MLGAPPDVPLPQDILPPGFTDGVRTVVFILADGLGLRLLTRWMEARRDTAFHQVSARGVLKRMTTILPSTTTAALTTFATGKAPAQHGMVGYKLFLREIGAVSNMIQFGPATGGREFAGHYLNPGNFLSVQSLYQKLKALEIPSTAMVWRAYENSALSRMLYRGAEIRSYVANHDAFVLLRDLVGHRPAGPSYFQLYWDEMDVVQHRYGPDSIYADEALAGLAFAMQQLLTPAMRQPDILYLMSADHGHVHTSDAESVNLRDHTALMRMLLSPPCGDARLPFLYPRPDSVDDVERYVRTNFGHCMDIVRSRDALEAGWFGPGKPHPEALSRLGHFMLVPHGRWKVIYPNNPDDKDYIGKHGGVSADEMEVPFLAWRWV